MATPTYRAAKNGYFYVHWSEARRSHREALGTKDEAEARKAFARWLLDEGKTPEGTKLTVRELWSAYWSKHVVPKTVSVRLAGYRWNNLEKFFGDMKLSAVTQDAVDRYEQKRVAGKIGRVCRPAAVRLELSYLKSCFGWCAHPRRKIITKAEMPDFALPEPYERRDRWLQIPEVQQLLTSARALRNDRQNREDRMSRAERFLWLALETAARKRAIEELTWDRVDFETGVIHYSVPGRRKTKKRRASPPISKALRPVLLKMLEQRRDGCAYVLDNDASISVPIKKVADHAGLGWVTPHVLRHTAATHMCRRGVPIATVADVLGNGVAVVAAVYRHHCPEATRDAVERISEGVLQAAE